MNLHFSMWVFLAVFPFAIGYIVSESRSLSLPQIAVAILVLYAFMGEHAKIGLPIMIGAFGVGFILPHIEFMQGVRNTLYNLYSSVRHRRLYEEIKRKADEFEEAKAQYERAADAAERARQHYEEATQRENQERKNSSQGQSGQQRHSSSSQQQSNSHQRQQQSSGSSQQRQKHQRKSSYTSADEREILRARHLKTLGLNPNKSYTLKEVKRAFRVMSMKHHPDRKRDGDKDETMMKEVLLAWTWLKEDMS